MNDSTIESIEWHKEQLMKLSSDEIDLYKVESELDDVLEKAKSKKRIPVRRGGKIYYREQEVGSEKGDSDTSGPKGVTYADDKKLGRAKVDTKSSDLVHPKTGMGMEHYMVGKGPDKKPQGGKDKYITRAEYEKKNPEETKKKAEADKKYSEALESAQKKGLTGPSLYRK